ncbi:MAG: nickel pincer cofactor biosynthesis protein LarB [Armatimonadota bacterium]|jgi:NCAIR mutase (PurE)-related protein
MNPEEVKKLMERVRAGEIHPDEACRRLRALPFEDLGFARVDHHRALRRGFPETVLAEPKTPEQVARILQALADKSPLVIASRASEEHFAAVRAAIPEAEYHAEARIIRVGPIPEPDETLAPVVIVTAGTSDIPVAEEAAVVAELAGCPVERIYDVGVAGIHRLLGHAEQLQRAGAIVVAAGMEGALASVVGGLVDAPVIAVPTSVGYGAAFEGLAALLGMLNSCASGVVVVNIDNGFGAGRFASMICRRA